MNNFLLGLLIFLTLLMIGMAVKASSKRNDAHTDKDKDKYKNAMIAFSVCAVVFAVAVMVMLLKNRKGSAAEHRFGFRFY